MAALFHLKAVNAAMHKDGVDLSIGILDIYGFEIFQVSVCLCLICCEF